MPGSTAQLLERSTALPFTYSVVRAARKTLAVYVHDARVEVRAPKQTSDAEISEFVHKHLRWINRKLAYKADQAQQMLNVQHGAGIFYKGKNLRIVFAEANRDEVVVTGQEFIIQGRRLDAKRARKVLEVWLLHQARNWLPERTRALAEHLRVGHKLKEVVFRKTKTKWGHCTASGRIQYNWLIMLAPDAIIDYMICHETCHLLQMNHSKKYWHLVATVCPDYRFYIKWLKQHEHRFWPE